MKEELLQLIAEGRAKEAADLLPFIDDAPPKRPGQWTAKDQLAHLVAWRQTSIEELDAVQFGRPGPKKGDDDQVENAKIYARTHNQPAVQVVEESRVAWDRLTAATEACTEEDLHRARSRFPEQELWQAIPSSSYYHLADHLTYWHEDEGHEKAAEAAAKWGHDLAVTAFPDSSERGVVDYNLGCFYAKRGRAAEAIPLLRSGFERRPDLREWAKQDPDLDPIRTNPELEKLMA